MRSVESMPAERERNHRRVELAGVASDAVDGVTRLLTDVAKFDLTVRELYVLQDDCGDASIRMTLVVPSELDVANVCSRLTRRVTINSLRLA
jgi:hypothetical protein